MYKGSHSGRAQVRGLLCIRAGTVAGHRSETYCVQGQPQWQGTLLCIRAATAAGHRSEAYCVQGQPQWQGRGQMLTVYKGNHSGRAQVRGLLSVTIKAETVAGQMSEAYRALGQPQWQGRSEAYHVLGQPQWQGRCRRPGFAEQPAAG